MTIRNSYNEGVPHTGELVCEAWCFEDSMLGAGVAEIVYDWKELEYRGRVVILNDVCSVPARLQNTYFTEVHAIEEIDLIVKRFDLVDGEGKKVK